MATKISWCDETINPVVGCSKISAGCQNCYAENMARRLAAMGMEQYKQVVQRNWPGADKWNGKSAFVESELWKPHKWKKPRSIFVSSMGDMFHETVNIKWQLDVLDMVYGCPQHTFIMLTKRPSNMKLVIDAYAKENGILPNLVLGVTAENQAMADARITVLLQIPAAKRFLSVEPMVGPVDLSRYLTCDHKACNDYGTGPCDPAPCPSRAIAGVILGGESGQKGRRMEPLWAMNVRDQCAAAGVPFMFKQWNHENRNEVDETTGFPWLGSQTHSALAW